MVSYKEKIISDCCATAAVVVVLNFKSSKEFQRCKMVNNRLPHKISDSIIQSSRHTQELA